MRILLFLNTIILAAAALTLIFAPTLLLSGIDALGDGQELGHSLARNYGFATLAIAALSGLMMSRSITDELSFVGAGTLAVFHLGLTLANLLNVTQGLVSLAVVGIHGVFAIIFLAIFIWKWRK